MKASVLGLLLLLVLAVSACGPAATPAPTATPEPVLATRVEDIVGTWEGIGFDGFFHRFNADGTFQTGVSLERLLAGPDMSGVFRFEGTRFFLTALETPNLVPCQAGAETGTYEVQLLANGNINFVVVEDNCGRRRRTMSLEHRPVQ